ncbi:hypothetical protein [Parasulfitobacter algicola]|uniref:Lysozyme inhibitor LprI N-terminal domain-containing protein n=1 Tax=Parasulfitobacter algicola TaxID=2614809 RepID=A0ABX2ISI7_9RHOB|nr:hypothetical protein [Sulfitobacter algicola]NSX55872.1 hypothetical protein [Sulfitobacter algicola]
MRAVFALYFVLVTCVATTGRTEVFMQGSANVVPWLKECFDHSVPNNHPDLVHLLQLQCIEGASQVCEDTDGVTELVMVNRCKHDVFDYMHNEVSVLREKVKWQNRTTDFRRDTFDRFEARFTMSQTKIVCELHGTHYANCNDHKLAKELIYLRRVAISLGIKN